MGAIRTLIRSAIHAAGYDLHRLAPIGRDPFLDMRTLIPSQSNITIFDVGANVGQTIQRLRETFPEPTIHAFEPGSDAFDALRERYFKMQSIDINNIALGDLPGNKEFIENTLSDMSSFLEPDEECWGTIKQRRRVEVTTIDQYCKERGIDKIDILKSDTQGFDLEVLKGAAHLLARHGIHLIYLEINFGRLYKKSARLDEIYAFLSEYGFDLVSFYKIYYINGLAKWTDALFVNPQYNVAL
jgi:FkbM family methyltransferase